MREFTDPQGQLWTVWRVVPQATFLLERRQGGQRPEERNAGPRLPQDIGEGAEERRLGDLRKGWLCFEAAGGGERRRFYPVPNGWENWTDERLSWLCARAVPVAVRGATRLSSSSR